MKAEVGELGYWDENTEISGDRKNVLVLFVYKDNQTLGWPANWQTEFSLYKVTLRQALCDSCFITTLYDLVNKIREIVILCKGPRECIFGISWLM